jgi:DNA repair protein RAD50
MTSIEKLHISGIRSFNPNPAERQTITFHKPLTIILGKNGAGKTTIIESLLNATTGEMPPGAAAAEKSAFVYDPKAAGESEVKAQIRLIFTGKGGRAMQVIRSFQATRTKGKVKFETLDSVLACKDDASGKVQSATYRASDCDRLVPEMLGVPRAVLEHVIFCHQEDCNWPLGPPGEVKKRFDDIFASTRYVAALDKLRETSKEYKDQQKQNEAVLIALREHREQAKALQGEADEKHEQVRLIEARNKEIEPRLQQLAAAVAAMDGIAHRVESMAQEVSTVRGRVAEKERALAALQHGMAGAPQHSHGELMVLQRDFAEHMRSVEAELQATATKLQACEGSRRMAEGRASEARATLHMLEAQAAGHARQVAELQRVIASITTEFAVGEGEMDTHALKRIDERMTQRVAQARGALEQLRADHAESMRAIHARRDDVLRAMDADAKERDMKAAQAASITERIQAAAATRPKVTEDQVVACRAAVEALSEKARSEAAARRAGHATTELASVITRVEAAQAELSALSDIVASSRANAEVIVRMGFLRATIQEREAAAVAVLRDHVVPGLRGVGAPRITATDTELPSLKAATDAAASVKGRKVKALQQGEEDARRADHETTSLQLRLQDTVRRLSEAERDLIANRSAVHAALGGAGGGAARESVATALAQAEENLQRANRKLTSLQSLAKCYESFIASAKSEHACVVCKRGLDAAGVESFIKINEDRQRTTPEQIEAAKKDAATLQATVERLRKALPAEESAAALERTIPQLKDAIKAIEAELQAKRAVVADLATKRRELQRQLESVDSVVTDLARLETDAAETARLETELAGLQRQHDTAGTAGGKTVPRDVLQRQYDDKLAEVQALNARLVTMQREAAAAAGNAGNATEEAMLSKRAELGDLEVALRRAQDVDTQITESRREVEQHRARVAAIAERRGELTKTLDGITAEAERLQAAWITQSKGAEERVAAAERDAQRFADGARAVRDYFESKSADKVANARASLKAAEQAIRKLEEEAKALSDGAQKARAALDDQHRQRQTITDSIRYLELQHEIEKDRRTIAAAEAELLQLRDEKLKDVVALLGPEEVGNAAAAAAGGAHVINRARDRCRAKAGEMERQRAQNNGALETLVRDVNERRATLNKDKYKDIEKRYSSTFIKVQTTELAIEDIEKYYRALEKAVSSYHADKVSQINKIVGSLWQSTYRGTDIDTIEIRSEDEGGSTIARRSYKYRVVMRRGDTELDMRGRCSAGQKVLAAVIIRMALSEAFCCDCGILALDEPTTNLDEDNAKALAKSLRELINHRRTVSHFQLVVITHDEEFVRTLGADHRADSFYYVQKDREGTFSTITERRFGDLFM